MGTLPTGTVTFLFTDIEGSTQLWEEHPEAMKDALAQHDSILREAIETSHGVVIKGTGDGVHGVFERAIDAIRATLMAQRSLQAPLCGLSIRVRMGLHTGEAEMRGNDYYGQALNRTARLMTAGAGGQILLSAVTAEVAREHLPADVTLLDLGEHHLKDLVRPEHVFQLSAADLPNEFPPVKSLNSLPNNLPAQLTSFIGREREMQEAKRLLASTRLLTLIGPGGTGKTRLSLQVAAEELPAFPHGVWLVELAPLSDPSFILSTLASVLELHEVPGLPLLQVIIDYLRAKHLLLVLDNCEHLVEESAQIAQQLLQACPHVKIIASSREALGVDGETVFRVPSLSLPDPASTSLMDYESTRLFVERASRAEPRFQLTDHNAAAIAQICLRLDGIPLAIELAAARVKLFTPEQIAARLDDRFKLLTGGSRTALPRQQTLRALIDWSYQSLNESEQRALRRLAVFSGGWSFEAAEAVVGGVDTLEALLGLVNKSLVNVEARDDTSRYRYLETIRQYAMEKLVESGEAADARDRHLAYFLQSMERPAGLAPVVFGEEDTDWLDRMEMEHDNLRAALEWAAAHAPERALKLVYAAGGFWVARDYNHEARAWCQSVLERTQSLPDVEEARAKVYAVFAWNSIVIGEHKTGREAAEAGILLARGTDQPATLARLLVVLGLACTFLGDFPAAEKAMEEAERLAEARGAVEELSLVYTTQGQLAYLAYQDADRARAYLTQASAMRAQTKFRWSITMSTFGMARLAGEMGDLDMAREKFAECAEFAREIGNKRLEYSSCSELAHVLRQHGELEEPLRLYRDVLGKWRDLGHRAAVAHELECIAYILSRKAQLQRAAMLLGAARSLRKVIDSHPTVLEQAEYERELSALQEALSKDEFARAWERGQSSTMDDAITLAVQPG